MPFESWPYHKATANKLKEMSEANMRINRTNNDSNQISQSSDQAQRSNDLSSSIFCVFRKTRLLLGLAFLLVFSGFANPTSADEEYSRFLAALQARGVDQQDVAYFEIAFDYLESLEQSDLVSDAIKQTLGFEKGKLLIGSTKFIRNRKQQLATLERGKDMLQEFVKTNSSHPFAAEAKNELANLLILSARRKIADDAGKNSELVTAARKDYAEAGGIVIDTRNLLRDQLKKIPATPYG